MSVKNNLKINIHRHSEGNVMTEESTAMYSNVMDPSVGYASLKDDNRAGQRGRSMVEMLGVLAIVGVLSVGGVYGYGVAMKKHKANELLHQASIHAATVSAQIMSGKTPSNIQNLSGSSANFSQEVGRPNSDQFVLTAKDVDSAVCEQMQAMKGSMVREVVCGATDANGKTSATLTYNNDLSKNVVAADYNKDTSGLECEKAGYKWCTELSTPVCKKDCCEGITLNDCQESCDSNTGAITPKDDDTECTTADGKKGTCNAGVCEEKADYTDVVCTDYQNNTECGGVGSGYYCLFNQPDSFVSGDGVCEKISDETQIVNTKLWVGPELNWWSANAWCVGKGTSGLISLSSFISRYACSGSTWVRCDDEKLSNDGIGGKSIWTQNVSYSAGGEVYFDFYYVADAEEGGVITNEAPIQSSVYTLCE